MPKTPSRKTRGEVLKLPQSKIDEFRDLIQQTSLTSLVGAMRLVTGRLDFITGL